jgi:hypothetical protein
MAYLICCEYPAHPPADGSLIAKGSADTVLVVTLRFASCSSCYCPEFDALLPKHIAVFTELLYTSVNHYTCHHNTSANTSTYELAASCNGLRAVPLVTVLSSTPCFQSTLLYSLNYYTPRKITSLVITTLVLTLALTRSLQEFSNSHHAQLKAEWPKQNKNLHWSAQSN